jgi:hypothetical protein
VTLEVVPGFDRPSRRTYSITETGRQTLKTWVDQSAASNKSLKTFVVCLLLAGSFSPLKLLANLRQRRTQVAIQYAHLEQALRMSDGEIDPGQGLTTTELDRLSVALDQLFRRAQRGKDAQNQSVILVVHSSEWLGPGPRRSGDPDSGPTRSFLQPSASDLAGT